LNLQLTLPLITLITGTLSLPYPSKSFERVDRDDATASRAIEFNSIEVGMRMRARARARARIDVDAYVRVARVHAHVYMRTYTRNVRGMIMIV
jgi:hypothetical protein